MVQVKKWPKVRDVIYGQPLELRQIFGTDESHSIMLINPRTVAYGQISTQQMTIHILLFCFFKHVERVTPALFPEGSTLELMADSISQL